MKFLIPVVMLALSSGARAICSKKDCTADCITVGFDLGLCTENSGYSEICKCYKVLSSPLKQIQKTSYEMELNNVELIKTNALPSTILKSPRKGMLSKLRNCDSWECTRQCILNWHMGGYCKYGICYCNGN